MLQPRVLAQLQTPERPVSIAVHLKLRCLSLKKKNYQTTKKKLNHISLFVMRLENCSIKNTIKINDNGCPCQYIHFMPILHGSFP